MRGLLPSNAANDILMMESVESGLVCGIDKEPGNLILLQVRAGNNKKATKKKSPLQNTN